MKRLLFQLLAASFMSLACGPFVLGWQAALHFGSLTWAPAQSAAAPARGQSKSQKVSNPLNDLLDEAQRDIDANNFEAAVPPLQKFIAEKPDVAYGHFQLGYTYTALKRGDEAQAEYERAIALDPKMPEAYLNLGILLMDKQHYVAAVVPFIPRGFDDLGHRAQAKFQRDGGMNVFVRLDRWQVTVRDEHAGQLDQIQGTRLGGRGAQNIHPDFDLGIGIRNSQMNVSHGDACVIGGGELAKESSSRGREQTEPSHGRYPIMISS